MQVALLGTCEDAWVLANAAVAKGHTVIWLPDAGGPTEIPKRTGSPEPLLNDSFEPSPLPWREALNTADVTAAIVAKASQQTAAERMEQLKTLLQLRIPALVVHPVLPTLVQFLEVDMWEQAEERRFLPFLPQQNQFAQLSTAEDTETGHSTNPLQQITWTSHRYSRSPQEIFTAFAQDVLPLARVAGPFDRLQALGSDTSAESYARLSIQLDGPAQIPVRWIVGPPRRDVLAEVEFIGPQGVRTLDLSIEESTPPTESATEAWKEFTDAVAAETFPQRPWQETVRAMELADTIEISLRRGRAIEIHHQEVTESTVFRGRMAQLGCALILGTPMILFVVGMLEGVFRLGWLSRWYVLLLLVLLFFLLLQTLPKLLGMGSDPREDSPAGQDL